MANQIVYEDLEILEISSFIRGYHVYKDIWSPVREELLLVKQETNNSHDSSAVAIMKENVVVGHVPYNLASSMSHFLGREFNKAFAVVVGDKVNRGAGYGLEIPCIYRLYGPKKYIN